MHRVIGVVVKPGIAEALHALARLRALAPGTPFIIEGEGHHALAPVPEGVEPVDAATFAREVDLVVVLGGDGTLIHAAHLLQERVVPILGVNMGRIGFLTEVRRDELAALFPHAVAGELPHSDRLRLKAELWRERELVLSLSVLNDAVVAQLALSRVATYRIHRGAELVTVVRGDGVIVSTPTGSTAYSMAAGGSILEPSLEAWAVTPICPHALTQRPLVINTDGEIKVTLESDSTVYATLDGQVGKEFRRGDVLALTRSPVPTRLLSVPGRSHFETLRTKLRWGEA